MGDILDDILGPATPEPKGYKMSGAERAAFEQDYARQMNDDMSGFERFAVGAGRGFNTIGRAVGLVEPEDRRTKAAADDLTDRYGSAMVGEIVGEAAPFLPLGSAMGAKFLANKLGTRILLSTGLGAAEGAAIIRGKGGDLQETLTGAGVGGVFAGSFEALFPVLGRMGRGVFRKLGRTPKGPLLSRAGEPTEEMLSALKEAGVSWDDLTDDAVDFIVNNQDKIVDPTEVARRSRFDKQGIPYTKGDVSQDFTQQAREQRLLTSTEMHDADALRELKLRQSGEFGGKVQQFADVLGDASAVGDSVKQGLKRTEKLTRAQKNRFYRQAGEADPKVLGVPIFTDALADALPDAKTMKRLGRLEGAQVKALDNLLVEFGVNTSDDAVEAFGDEVTPLTIGNLEDFRIGLNQIIRADQTGAASVAAKPIINALDGEADNVIKEMRKAGIDDEGVLDLLRGGRAKTRELKTEFSPESIAGRLSGVKRDGVTPIVEASKVVDELYSKPVEQLQRTLSSLSKSGKTGRKAIGDLRAAVVFRALDDAMKAPSRKISGVEVIGGNQFAKSLRKFGDKKLDVLFRGDEKSLKELRAFAQTGLDMQASAGATPKGSAAVNLDIAVRVLSRLHKIPAVKEVVGFLHFIGSQSDDASAVVSAVKAKPQLMKTAGFIEAELPALGAAIGIAAFMPPIEKREPTEDKN